MFEPPFCPHRSCRAHAAPGPRFFLRHGTFRPRCRAHLVPRFRCRSCRRTFSRQTFRADYRDHRPDLNAPLLRSLARGSGLREAGRQLGLSLRCTELKARKIGRHLRRLNLNLRGQLPPGSRLVFDELETYETRRNTRPLTVPFLVDVESLFIVWAESAPIRPSGEMSQARKAALAQDEARYGRRKDLSRQAALRTLRRGVAMLRQGQTVRVDTDEKSTYGGWLRRVFGARIVEHQRTNSLVPREIWNPLFPVNSEEARARDMMGRLRRESWLVSKARRWLDIGLQVHIAYRNYVRRRSTEEACSPAMRLGILKRRLRPEELLSWSQDWGARCPLPIGRARGGIVRA
jgi:transposase-like protein